MKPVLIAALVAASAPATVRAAAEDSEPDPRWLYTVELAVGGAVVGEISTPRLIRPSSNVASFLSPVVRTLVMFPVAESTQASAGLVVDREGFVRGVGGLRLLTGWENWQTRLDLQGSVAFINAISIGGRVAAGASWQFAPGWRLGADLGAALHVGQVIVALDLQAAVAYGF